MPARVPRKTLSGYADAEMGVIVMMVVVMLTRGITVAAIMTMVAAVLLVMVVVMMMVLIHPSDVGAPHIFRSRTTGFLLS